MQSKKGIVRLLSASMYVFIYICMGFGDLHAKNKFTKSKYFNSTIVNIGLASRLYQCESSSTSSLLAAYATQRSKLPTSVKPVEQELFTSCSQETKLSCPAKLNINGSISITDSKNVAITVSKLSDITVEEGGLQYLFLQGVHLLSMAELTGSHQLKD